MKKILIVVECFAPINMIAAIRPTKLAKYFKLDGSYHVSVLSRKLRKNEIADTILQQDLRYVDDHIIINNSWIMQFLYFIFFKSASFSNKANKYISLSSTTGRKKISIHFVNSMITHLRQYFIFRLTIDYGKMAVKRVKNKYNDYDIVLTSAPLSAESVGFMMKRKNPNILWIADYRDPLTSCFPERRHHKYCHQIKNMVMEKADIITGVSSFCTEEYNEYCSDKIHTICNGFDRSDIDGIGTQKKTPGDKFSLTYAGTLYDGKQDVSIVFRAISELIRENKISANDIVVNYMGANALPLKKQASSYSLLDIVKDYGKVNREKSLQFQLNSDILLLASWNNNNGTGIVTGKFLEYMMIDKPIICAVVGNLPNSILKEMITKANNGIVWEQVNDNMDYPRLKGYLLEQYRRHSNRLPLLFESNVQYIEQFNYKNITQKFVEIIKACER